MYSMLILPSIFTFTFTESEEKKSNGVDEKSQWVEVEVEPVDPTKRDEKKIEQDLKAMAPFKGRFELCLFF